MMNTLANHGYLPHDGRNLTQDAVVSALKNGINFDEGLGTLMFQMAVPVNPEPNATFFTLDQLNQHNVLEHDASLSRSDAFFGNNHVFNETVFETSIKYWSGEILDANQLAMSKVFRQVESKAFNPEYTFSTTTEAFSLGELAAPIIVFGDHASSTVNRTLVEYFFRTSNPPCTRAFCCFPPPLGDCFLFTDFFFFSNLQETRSFRVSLAGRLRLRPSRKRPPWHSPKSSRMPSPSSPRPTQRPAAPLAGGPSFATSTPAS